MDLTRHTHSSAWHTMHNVIYGVAKSMDECLETLKISSSKVKIYVIQGDQDHVVPLECSANNKMKLPDAVIKIIKNADHSSSAGPAYRHGRLLPRAHFIIGPHFIVGSFLK